MNMHSIRAKQQTKLVPTHVGRTEINEKVFTSNYFMRFVVEISGTNGIAISLKLNKIEQKMYQAIK